VERLSEIGVCSLSSGDRCCCYECICSGVCGEVFDGLGLRLGRKRKKILIPVQNCAYIGSFNDVEDIVLYKYYVVGRHCSQPVLYLKSLKSRQYVR
jgi:hypothetical protein